MSTSPTPPTPQRSESLAGRFRRNPIRTLTMGARPASPSTTTTTTGRATPTRSSTRDSSTPPPTTRTRSSIIPSAFQRKVSSTLAPSSTKASSSKAPSSEAVNEFGAKTEPSTTEQGSIDAPKEDTSADVSGHARALSGSTVESEPPMTPPPTQTIEPVSIPKSEDPASDSPHDGASIASSRSPSRLRRQVSNLSRRSVSGSIRRLSLLGPASPPQVETAPIHAQGEMQKSLSRSPSVSSLRRHAASPEPIPTKTAESISTPEPVSEPEVPQSADPQSEPEIAQPEPAQTEVPQAEVPEPETEAPKPEPQPEVQPEVQPAAISTPKEVTPAPSVKAPSPADAPVSKPVEPQTPVKPSMSRNASTTSLGRSPTPDKPDAKRRSTFTKWARKSLDRRPSVSGSPGPGLVRSPSRGPVDDDSDTESVKERERKWGTGLPVPDPPAPKKSEDNIKRRFSLGRRDSTKSPNESASEPDKKSGWSKVIRAVTKPKKEKTDSSSSTPEASSIDVSTEPSEPRPSLMIPDRVYSDPRPLSAIVESPVVPLNPHMFAGAQSPEQVMGAPISVGAMDSPVVVKAETTSPEMSPVMVNIDSDTSGLDSAAENLPALDAVAAQVQPTTETIVEEPTSSTELEQPKGAPAPVEETLVVVDEVVAPEAEVSTTPVAEPTTTVAEPTPTSAPVENLMSPISPNSPASSPWDAGIEREIARARSPRQSNGGPSTSNRRGSPAPSIIGVKRKHPDEPTEVGKARVRYLPDWAVSPAIQLAVTLSLVLPRRKRDVANPSNRKRGGWWPLRRGQRTEMRFNAIRGVNEEVPIVSKTWAVPAAVRTTAKVVTAPARRGDIEWGPVDETEEEDLEDEAPRRFEFSLSPSPEPDLECPR
ncbi:unnamed protein product [Rhizoctonia solani]|uniref:Uncharacterized protein n=1 Tax=Rhizoctonia solani TaxID=456999 RepID=A0A8H2XEI8_9AGAM|nr:unnamed protein product [Rhizoctonia solani]